MTAPDPRRAEGVGSFDVSVDDIAALLPQVTIVLDTPTPTPGANSRPVTVDQVRSWIDQVSSRVDVALLDRSRILDGTRSTALVTAAKGVVVNGVASWTAAAAFPTKATPNSDQYHQVLWDRYTVELRALQDQLAGWITTGGEGVVPIAPASGGAASFPPPTFLDRAPDDSAAYPSVYRAASRYGTGWPW